MRLKICMVPKDWQHPKDTNGNYLPLYTDNYETDLDNWFFHRSLWVKGIHPAQAQAPILKRKYPTYAQYAGNPPRVDQYIHNLWGRRRRTHLQLYIVFYKSVPLSPVFGNLEELEMYIASNLKTISYIERYKIISQFKSSRRIIEIPTEPIISPPEGQDQFESTYSSFTKKIDTTYQYRHTDGELFFCTGDNLEQSKIKKDRWLEKKNPLKGGARQRKALTG